MARKPTARPVTRTKARQILHDRRVRGQALTDRQQRFFGAIASGAPAKRRAKRRTA